MTAVVTLGMAVIIVFLVANRDPTPGAFYRPPDGPIGPPGTILRAEPFDTGLPDGARGWRILYASTDEHGSPIAVSGLVIAPTEPADGPRPVLAWAHGTVGIAEPCAPSLSREPLAGIPDMTGPLAQGWVITLTDYPGLGTAGPHPYLVGGSSGRAVLDSVRAAHALDSGLELDDAYAIWGHSQGGHSALFAGQLATDYLPDHELVGVVALAPATRLADDLAAIQGTQTGDVLTILAVDSWSRYFAELTDDVLAPAARGPAAVIAAACLNQPSVLRLMVGGRTLPEVILTHDVVTDPAWAARLEENSPRPAGIAAPLLVAQGLTDEVVAPKVTAAWVADRCRAGAPTTWHAYPGLGHSEVVEPGGSAALAWTIDRFEGVTTPISCPQD